MTNEQILLIVVFLAVPLIQTILRAMRKSEDKPAQAESLPSSAGRPPTRKLQPLPATEDRVVSQAMTTPVSEKVRKAGRSMEPPTRRSRRRGTPGVELRDLSDLRRAVVLMTLLGPCRAIEPHE